MTEEQSETVKWASINTANNEVSKIFDINKCDKHLKKAILKNANSNLSIGFYYKK